MPLPVIFLADGDLVEVAYQCGSPPQLGEFIIHYYTVGSHGTGCDLATALATLSSAAAPAIVALLSDQAGYAGTLGNIIGPGARSTQLGSGSGAGPGTAGSSLLPTQVCGIVQKLTDRAGQAHRGRMYVPFPDAGDCLASGDPSGGYQARLVTLAGIVLTATFCQRSVGNDCLLTPVIWHRNMPPSVLGIEYITGSAAEGRWATQRSRGAFGATNRNP